MHFLKVKLKTPFIFILKVKSVSILTYLKYFILN